MKVLVGVVTALLFYTALAKENRPPKGVDLSRVEAAYTFTYDNHTYQVSNFKEVWDRAKYYCKWFGMELLSIETEEEQLAINEILGTSTDDYWTSLNDIFEEDDYYWESTGDTVGPYTNWGEGEPTRNSTYNCMLLSRGVERSWDVVQCYFSHRYICESRNC